jgi:insecticidal toxin complex protein TccC
MPIQMPDLNTTTPTLKAIDPRGMPVRSVGYCSTAITAPAEAHINRTAYDFAGRPVASRDPRLTSANLTTIHSLSGQVLSTLSVDAGWRAQLPGEANQPVHGWDDRGSQRRVEYDRQLRPTAVFEQALAGESLCSERCVYGDGDPTFATRNQCGRLIRHDDPAGTQLLTGYGLTGAALEQTRHFLQARDSPDWPELVVERDVLLEPGAGAISQSVVNPLGEAIQQIDAKGNRQFFSHTRDGQLREVRLQLKNDTAPKTLVSAIQYDAQGQTEQETAGNGVITKLQYDPEDGRLTRLQARRGNDVLQDLRYAYDPVGNVLSVEDAALPIRYFANQRIEPVNRYVYDSLYQLIKATGWEAGGANQGPLFSAFGDPAACANFTQTYRYDRGGNLLELTHEGPQQHGHRLVAATQSNRCLPVLDGVEPDERDFCNGFDANGNSLILQPGQSLHWDLRNQLRAVRPVERDGAADDDERYIYGANGMRLRKIRQTQTNARALFDEVRYLSSLQIRTHSGTGETLQIITVQAGRSSVQVLHWESEPPKGIGNDQHRYSLADHLGSCTLELDSAGQVISHERYHPFGTTAWFAGREEVEASYKRLRYSGKERDCTGLYYYGFRYHVAWLQRWLNPDPAGVVDGLNLYTFAKNNPSSGYDVQGLSYKGANDKFEKNLKKTDSGYSIKYRGNAEALDAGEKGFSKSNDAAWKLSAKLVKATIKHLKSGPSAHLDRFLRGDSEITLNSGLTVAESMLKTYQSILKEIPRYQKGGDLRDQIVYLQGESALQKADAFVYPMDPHRRIFVTDSFRSSNVIGRASTFIHELSHLVADTEDTFRYPKPDIINDTSVIEAAASLKRFPKQIARVHAELRYTHRTPGHAEHIQSEEAETLALFSLTMLKDKDVRKGIERSVDPFIKGNRQPRSGNQSGRY